MYFAAYETLKWPKNNRAVATLRWTEALASVIFVVPLLCLNVVIINTLNTNNDNFIMEIEAVIFFFLATALDTSVRGLVTTKKNAMILSQNSSLCFYFQSFSRATNTDRWAMGMLTSWLFVSRGTKHQHHKEASCLIILIHWFTCTQAEF